MKRLILSLVLVPVVFAFGCGGGSPSAKTETTSAEASTPAASEPSPAAEPAAGEVAVAPAQASATPEAGGEQLALADVRTTFGGNWNVQLMESAHWIPIGLLEIQQQGTADAQVTLLGTTQAIAQLQLTAAEIKEDQASLDFMNGDQPISFKGKLQAGAVEGNFYVRGQTMPGRMTATDVTNSANLRPERLEEQQALVTALNSEDSYAGLQKFIADNPNSPLVLEAYERSFRAAAKSKIDAAAVEKLFNDFMAAAGRWGERMQQYARLESAFQLAISQGYPELALKISDEVEKSITDANRADWEPPLKMVRSRAQTSVAIRNLGSGNADEQAAAIAKLNEVHKAEPFNPIVTDALALHAEKSGKIDEALEAYAEIAAVPGMEDFLVQEWKFTGTTRPLPSETVARLWKEKNGNTDGLDQFLSDVYEKVIYSFATEKVELPENAGRQVALIEMFTGAQCPPCVAADVGVGAIERVYPKTALVALRYHMPIPGPDPLANKSTANRFKQYQLQGTPSILFNGKVTDPIGGGLSLGAAAFQRLKSQLDEELKSETTIAIALKADRAGETISYSADVTGVKELSTAMRLHLVVAEGEVNFVAPNGVRQHEMVVRDMPSGADGIAPEGEKFSHSGSVNLAELRLRLSDELADSEGGGGLAVKPLDLDDLQLVAFIQDTRNGAILQAARIEIPAAGEAADSAEAPANPAATATASTETAPNP